MKFVFLMTHLGSGSICLCESLKKVPYICCTQTNRVYTHPSDLDALKDRAKIFVDVIDFNYSFASTALYKCCKFIYLIRNPRQSFNAMKEYSPESAHSYYLFRLRRLYEMAYQAPGLFLTYEELPKNTERIGNFLGAKIPEIQIRTEQEVNVSMAGYEKYLKMFRALNAYNDS